MNANEVKSISSAAMMVVRSGVLSTVLSIGVDLLVVMFTDILLPYIFAFINATVFPARFPLLSVDARTCSRSMFRIARSSQNVRKRSLLMLRIIP